ncbi:hypothetical protein C3941_00310 [Kaistia algarum]|uniref:hypothetical protein n=1 Tax=Kaistia algarum TaxID=2083279 RepID=UPI000CE74D2D|nr:hypothetical protein [Kaistia algarum]MCX5513340.1 hypothetical protein [Kaistia algarum]PPE81209.1 hypothetical protein C3941_00310 [Kaistia algarum]
MIGETRLKPTALWAAIAMVVGIGIVEALDQFGAPPMLAAFFPLLPIAIVLIAGLRMGSLTFTDMIRGGAFGETATGWAVAGLSTGAVLLVAAPMATAFGGFEGLLLLAALLAGFGLAAFLLVPTLRATSEPTLAAAIGTRFGSGARSLAAIAIGLALVPLLAAEASLAGLMASRMLGVSAGPVRDGLIVLALIACLIGGVRAALAMAAIATPIVALAYWTPVAIVSLDLSAFPMPWIGLAEGAMASAPARVSGTIVLALVICLVAGVATLPTLLLPAWSKRKRPTGPRSRWIAFCVAGALILAAPSYALLGSGLGIDATVNPAGLVLNFAGSASLSALPSVLLIGGLLVAALVAATALLATAAAGIGNDLYAELIEGSAPEGRRIFIARLSMVVIALCAAGLSRATQDDVALLAGSGLSISAASLGPLLLVGWPIRSVGSVAAVSAISVGLWLTVADIGLALLFPDVAGRFLGMGTIAPTVLGPTGWFGLPVALSGMTGVIFGVITLWAVTELPRTDWRRLGIKLQQAGATTLAAARRTAEQVRPKAAAVPSASEPSPAASLPTSDTPMANPVSPTEPVAMSSSSPPTQSAAPAAETPAS